MAIKGKTKPFVFLLLILTLAAFFRFHRLSQSMAFGGDVARDFLVARDVTLKGKIPLLGCPSSVPWLHQGALFIYLLSLPLALGGYHPLAGGYFVAFLGVLATAAVYFLGKLFFNEKTGLWAAFLYATFPLVILFERQPYHLSPISLVTVLFFFSLYSSFQKPKLWIVSAFIFGLLMQLELSNLVFLPILIILFLDLRKQISFKILIFSVIAFGITWIPKIMADFYGGFSQTLGFAAWIVHKLWPLDFIDLTYKRGLPLLARLKTISDYLARVLFWSVRELAWSLFLLAVILVLRNFNFKKRHTQPGLYLIFLWVCVPFLGFLLHGFPSESYMPIVFALPAIVIGCLISRQKGGRLILLLAAVFLVTLNNLSALLKHDYFVINGTGLTTGDEYNWGNALVLDWQMAEFLVKDANGRKYNLSALGSFAHFPSAKSSLEYLTWYLGNEPSAQEQKLKYFVYTNQDRYEIDKIDFTKRFSSQSIARRIYD